MAEIAVVLRDWGVTVIFLTDVEFLTRNCPLCELGAFLMDVSDQLGPAVTLGIVVAVGLGVFFLVALLLRAVWRWITGAAESLKRRGKSPSSSWLNRPPRLV
jgi:hypothetical protein